MTIIINYCGGSKLVMPKLKLLISKYIYKKFEVSKVSPKPYETHEVHGRGVMISRSVYNMIGTLDWKISTLWCG